MPSNTLLVVPTSRAKREILATKYGFAPKILTMQEFEQRLAVAVGKTLIDESTRLVLLKKAAEQTRDANKIGVSDDFLVFLENAHFFLGFFDELSAEGVEADELLKGDSYAEYDDHIAVLKELRANFRALLAEKSYIDRLSFAEDHTLNLEWLHEFESVTVQIEGALSRFELGLLRAAAATTPLHLQFELTPFDQKTVDAFLPLKLPLNSRVTLDLSNGAIIETTPIAAKNDIDLYTLNSRSEQAAAIIETVYRFVAAGIAPEKIVVVLPDESFAVFLREFDRCGVFNYAFGFPFAESEFYRSLNALCNFNADDRAAKFAFDRRAQKTENLRDLRRDFERQTPVQTYDLIEKAIAIASDKEREIAANALHEIKPILDEPLAPKEALRIYLQQLRKKSFDDTNGGKVTVMGVLETRATAFDGVIVADFNDGVAPKASEKDMFLSAAVRRAASLPTYADRADLQRSFFYRLFARSRKTTVFCVQNDLLSPSRFINELGLQARLKPFAIDEKLLFTPRAISRKTDQPFVREISLIDEPLSASKLRCYLECKRKFHHQYIEKLSGDDRFDRVSDSQEIGTVLHTVLKDFFSAQAPKNAHELKAFILDGLRENRTGARGKFDALLWSKKLDRFCENEVCRAADGWRTIECESPFEFRFEGVTLHGRIDRVDRLGDQTLVIDYKTGKTMPKLTPQKNQTDFQLIIYAQALTAKGQTNTIAAYYDISNGKILPLENPDQHRENLTAALALFAAPTQDFAQKESKTECGQCEYNILCGRQ
ncbi:hypothetical protein AGMMS50229_05020 [Campylobacterota bacterium]|nr:hypothetical protein AGMMS50229_05020 [Campylobacterota bacterium]